MCNYQLSKLYIQGIKGDLKKVDQQRISFLKAKKFFQVFENSELVTMAYNVHSCPNQALKAVLLDRISQPLTGLWKWLANINYNIEAYPLYYNNLLQLNDCTTYYEETIRKDVIRTTQDEATRQKLTNILNSYSKRNVQIGYCQGFNYIAYYLLQKFKEEEVFWFICHLFETILPPNYYNHLFGVLCDDQIIKQILQYRKPNLIKKFQELQVETSLFTIQWLVCCFTFNNALSELIIDLLLIEGSKALIKSVMTYLELLEKQIMNTLDIGEFMMSIEQFVTKFSDRELFLQEYRRIYINNKILQHIRQEQSKKVVQMVQSSDSKKAKNIDTFLYWMKELHCSENHFSCRYTLESWNRNKKHFDQMVFKESKITIIDQYEQTKSRRSILDDNDNLILRQIHICKEDDLMLIRELQYQDQWSIELTDIHKQQTIKQNKIRARSPIKEMLLFPLKVFSQKQQYEKLKPKVYMIDMNENTKDTQEYQPYQRKIQSYPSKNRARSPTFRRSEKPKEIHTQQFQPIEQLECITQIRNSMTIQFLSELAKTTNLINVDFSQS